jgi:Arc/MetJ-type ribon-helix-helix transcriptional regulator
LLRATSCLFDRHQITPFTNRKALTNEQLQIKVGRFTITQSSWTTPEQRCSRKWMSRDGSSDRRTIQLPAELERLILEDLQRGPYRTVDEFLEQAVPLLHDQEDWLAKNPTTIAKVGEAGWEFAAGGELRQEIEVRAAMEERKRAWIAQEPPEWEHMFSRLKPKKNPF